MGSLPLKPKDRKRRFTLPKGLDGFREQIDDYTEHSKN
jgi:hypothetical protein